jgi:hypothetical protein
MDSFLHQHRENIIGVLTGFDRIVFRGSLPNLSYVSGMESFLGYHQAAFSGFGEFVQQASHGIKQHARKFAETHQRPYLHIQSPGISKEQWATDIRDRDGIDEGLVCVFGCTETCQAYQYAPNTQRTGSWLRKKTRQCLHIYFYFMDREFGLTYVRLQTWFPMGIQIGVNGREYLARCMDRAGMDYEKCDNCFLRIDDVSRAQKMLDRLLTRDWSKFLNRLARQINPHLAPGGILGERTYYWTYRETETATDVMFRDAQALAKVYPLLVRHATEQFGCADVLRFLGRRTNSRFSDDPNTDRKKWIEGVRVKHRVEENSMKMYDKQGSVLRIETTIVNPKRFRVYREVTRQGERVLSWIPLRKGIMDTARRAEIGRAANGRYLEALGVVGVPTPTRQLLDPVSRRTKRAGRPYRGLRPIHSDDARVFEVVLSGEHLLQGFRNRDVCDALYGHLKDAPIRKRAAARVTRVLALLRAHKLIKRVTHTFWYRVTKLGHHIMSAALQLRNLDLATVPIT